MSAAQKTAILAQMGHFYFGEAGQYYVGANMKPNSCGSLRITAAAKIRKM